MLATGRRCSKKLKTRPLHGLLSTEEELSSRVGLHTGRDLLQQHPVSSIQPLLLALTNKLVFIQLPVPRVSECLHSNTCNSHTEQLGIVMLQHHLLSSQCTGGALQQLWLDSPCA